MADYVPTQIGVLEKTLVSGLDLDTFQSVKIDEEEVKTIVPVPVAKKVVNQFIKFGTKAGVNFNTSGDIDEIISDNPSLANSRENINGFYVGIYSEIKFKNLVYG